MRKKPSRPTPTGGISPEGIKAFFSPPNCADFFSVDSPVSSGDLTPEHVVDRLPGDTETPGDLGGGLTVSLHPADGSGIEGSGTPKLHALLSGSGDAGAGLLLCLYRSPSICPRLPLACWAPGAQRVWDRFDRLGASIS